MRVILILDKYLPLPHANGICAEYILRSFGSDCEVDIVCRVETNILSPIINNRKGWNVFPVTYKKESSYHMLGVTRKIMYVVRHIFKTFFSPIYSSSLAEAYTRKCEELIILRKPDYIISVLQPCESVEAGYRIKEKYPDINFIIYDLDNANSSCGGRIEHTFHTIYNKKIFHWEKKMFAAADLIIHLKQHESYFSQLKYAAFKGKTLFQDIPLLDIQVQSNFEAPSLTKEPSLIYAGNFYPRLREPSVMLDIIESASKKCRLHLKIYMGQNYFNMLKQKYSNSGYCDVEGYIPQNKLVEVSLKSDFLISIGNLDSAMFPSKIVSYVSMLKPIIHIYQDDTDPVIEYLEKYPNVLFLNSKDSIEDNADKLISFIKKTHTIPDQNSIKKIYRSNSAEYNAQEIITFFRR